MRVTRRKGRKIQRGGIPKMKIEISLPQEVSSSVSELLWLDNASEHIDLKLNTYSGIDRALKDVILLLGATESILERPYSVVCGPTGVGKTKFINNLKAKFGPEIINMDTMQVYDMISIGTGRTNLANTKGSHMYGIYNPNKQFHILDYLSDLIKELQKIEGKPVIFEGASKSLLDVIMHIFPNIRIFGIKAINEENITANITKRITDPVIKKVIMELSGLLKEDKVSYNSEVLKNNPEVYQLIISTFSKDELKDGNLRSKLDGEFSDKVHALTLSTIELNVKLHKKQFSRLQEVEKIQWFTNDDSSVELLEKAFSIPVSLPMKSILQETRNFNFINTESCSNQKSPSSEQCKEIDGLFHSEDRNTAIQFSARLNIPLLPKRGSNQIVIGTTKYLLPYAVLSDYFNMFAIKPKDWTLDRNMLLIECMALKFIDSPIIRIVTTPSELVDEKQAYRVTAKEICILNKYNYKFYKYDSNEFTNVYFCSKVPLSNCSLVDASEGGFRCNGNELGPHLFF